MIFWVVYRHIEHIAFYRYRREDIAPRQLNGDMLGQRGAGVGVVKVDIRHLELVFEHTHQLCLRDVALFYQDIADALPRGCLQRDALGRLLFGDKPRVYQHFAQNRFLCQTITPLCR